MTPTAKHHEFGPSSLARRALCPASYKVECGMPDMEGGEAATSGTCIHNAIESYINGGVLPDTPDPEKAEACVEFLEDYKKKHNITDVHAEYWMSANDPVGTIYTGTADVVMLSPDGTIHIIDWKTGFHRVADSKDNWQGKAYALAAMQSLGRDRCRVTFFNPTIGQISEAEFCDKDLLASQICQIIADCKEDIPSCCPGDEQCMYCKGALTGTCSAWRKWMELPLKVDQKENIEELPDDELALLYESCSRVVRYSELLKEEIANRFNERHMAIGGYVLKTRLGPKKILDVQKCFDSVSDTIPLPDFLKCVNVSITALDKAFLDCLKMNHPGEAVKAKEAKLLLEEKIGDNIVRGNETRTLAKA